MLWTLVLQMILQWKMMMRHTKSIWGLYPRAVKCAFHLRNSRSYKDGSSCWSIKVKKLVLFTMILLSLSFEILFFLYLCRDLLLVVQSLNWYWFSFSWCSVLVSVCVAVILLCSEGCTRADSSIYRFHLKFWKAILNSFPVLKKSAKNISLYISKIFVF